MPRTMPKVFLALALSACAGTAPAPKIASPGTPSGAPGETLAASPTIWVTPELGSPHPGEAAPDFDLVDQNGRPQKLSSYKGRIVVLSFLAGFCPFSKAEQPNLKKLAEDYAGKNVQVLGVLIKEDEADNAAFLSRMPMPFPVLRDATAAVGASYTPANAMPELTERTRVVATSNLVIDPDGKIVFYTLLDTAQFDAKLVHLRRALDKLIAEKNG